MDEQQDQPTFSPQASFPPPPPPPASSDGTQPSGPTPRGLRRAAVAGGLVAGLALGGTGIAFAAGSGSGSPAPGSSSTVSPSPTAPGSTSPTWTLPGGAKGARGAFPFPGARGLNRLGLNALGLNGLGGKVLYGQVTIQDRSGAIRTVDFQVGQVTSVNGTSISVSSPGHSQTYDIKPSTAVDARTGGISSVKSGDTVWVIATKPSGGSGAKDTALGIVDVTRIGPGRAGFGFDRPGRPSSPAYPANPTTPTTGSVGSTGTGWGIPGPNLAQ